MHNNEYLTLIHAQAKVIKLKAAQKLNVLYDDHAPSHPRPNFDSWIDALKLAVIVERDSNGDTFERIDTKQIFADVLYQKFERIKHNALERQIFMLFCYIALFEHYIERNNIDQALGALSTANQAYGAFCGIDISGKIFSHENSSKRDYASSPQKTAIQQYYLRHLHIKKLSLSAAARQIKISNKLWSTISETSIKNWIKEITQS